MTNERLKSIGNSMLGIVVFLAFSVLCIICIKGTVWMGEHAMQWLLNAASLVFVLDLIIIFPLAMFRRLRPWVGVALYSSSFLFGLATWFLGLLLTYSLWGLPATVVGVLLMGGGVVVTGLLAALFEGVWPGLMWLIIYIVGTFGTRAIGMRLTNVCETKADQRPSSARKGSGMPGWLRWILILPVALIAYFAVQVGVGLASEMIPYPDSVQDMVSQFLNSFVGPWILVYAGAKVAPRGKALHAAIGLAVLFGALTVALNLMIPATWWLASTSVITLAMVVATCLQVAHQERNRSREQVGLPSEMMDAKKYTSEPAKTKTLPGRLLCFVSSALSKLRSTPASCAGDSIPDLDPDEYDEKVIAGFKAMKDALNRQQKALKHGTFLKWVAVVAMLLMGVLLLIGISDRHYVTSVPVSAFDGKGPTSLVYRIGKWIGQPEAIRLGGQGGPPRELPTDQTKRSGDGMSVPLERSRYGSGREPIAEIRLRAAKGEAEAQFRLGCVYLIDDSYDGVPKDTDEAVKWFRRAAVQGHADAQYALGQGHRFGQYAVQDDYEAVKWLREAAEQGHADAQFSLGFMLSKTKEDDPFFNNDKEAAKWYLEAALQGNRFAQRNIGRMYRDGEGTIQNDVEAYAWAIVAASNDTRELLEIMESDSRMEPIRFRAQARAKELAEEIDSKKKQ